MQQEPFQTVGSIVELVQDNMDEGGRKIIRIIDEINRNTEEIERVQKLFSKQKEPGVFCPDFLMN